SSVLSDDQKAAIKKALASSGSDATFIVTGTAGKLPGVSDRKVKRLAKARAKAIKAYLVSLGVSKTRVTTQVKITEIGETPKSIGSNPTPAPTPSVTAINSTGTGSGSSSGGGGTPTVTCALGGTCAVGDRGPGGGIVFYVSAANFTSTGSTCNTACKYLEVAPATWQDTTAPIYTTVEEDRTYVWSNNRSTLTGQDITTASTEGIVANRSIEKLNWQIGQGFNNTQIMKVTGATSAAQAAVLAYSGNSVAGQWFIPSMNELNELCKYAWGQTTGVLTVMCSDIGGTLKTGTVNDLGGFVNANYMSSSEVDNRELFFVNFYSGGSPSSDWKSWDYYVRPIRAF
ncbi:MAG: hypothetical protein K9F97_02425, partial [Candidatus Nanopelagicales bacterium]|nr:hypothetical protein [Candidatus Nanopelagicales bacterium]